MGGDHKCPMCSATFTRPQHVGRHLRAHTGDRPYECKECPLKFARSDLLSRHVNKAHPKPDGADGQGSGAGAGGSGGVSGARKPQRKSFSHPDPNGVEVRAPSGTPSHAAPGVVPGTTQFQGQRMYPNHPLLQQPAWSSQPLSEYTAQMPTQTKFALPLTNTTLGSQEAAYAQAYNIPGVLAPPFSSAPIRSGSSEQGNAQALASSMPSFGFDLGPKKRACDLCNHSKVRCDFNTPCARCASRGVACTYNKPQRARSIAYPMSTIPSQSSSVAASTVNPALSLLPAASSSQSPQSVFSSPHSSGSPAMANFAAGYPYGMRRNSIAVPPTANQTAAMLTSNALTYGAALQAAGRPPVPDAQWQSIQTVPPHVLDPSSTQQTTAVYNPAFTLAGNMTAAPNPYAGLVQRTSGTSASSSPNQGYAPTPSLTSSQSPAESDMPIERRSSGISATGVPSWNPATQGTVEAALLPDGTYGLAKTFSAPPQMMQEMANPNFGTANAADTMPWAQQQAGDAAAANSGIQFRSPFGASDDDPSPPDSSSTTTMYRDPDEPVGSALHHRRRSSAGIWASAFDQMSLSDPAIATAFALTDPAIAEQVAQQLQNERKQAMQAQAQTQAQAQAQIQPSSAKRPAYPAAPVNVNGVSADPTRMSLSDMKDLWKMYMTDPISGTTPALDKHAEDPLSLAASGLSSGLTPRPMLGRRTLSKSNSMPDLTSPLSGQAFFSTYLTGTTPRPGDQQASYMPPPHADDAVPVRPEDMDKWKTEIKQRQVNFNMAPGAKMRGSSTQAGASPPGGTMPPPSATQRPALLQTLAPERTPSFGLGAYDPAATPHGLKTPAKLSSAFASSLARPGNKRLASQTLVPEAQKKTSLNLFDDPGFAAADGADAADDAARAAAAFYGPTGAAAAPPNALFPNTAAGVPPAAPVEGVAQANAMYYSAWPPLSTQ